MIREAHPLSMAANLEILYQTKGKVFSIFLRQPILLVKKGENAHWDFQTYAKKRIQLLEKWDAAGSAITGRRYKKGTVNAVSQSLAFGVNMSANGSGLEAVGGAQLDAHVAFCGVARAAPDALGGHADVGLQVELPVVVEVVAHLCRSADARREAETLTLARGEVDRSTHTSIEHPLVVEAVGAAA